MQNFKRTAMAYIVGRLISGKESGSIYDESQSSYFDFSGTVSDAIDVYDYSRSNYLKGDKTSIYDYGTSQYISLALDGNNFSGHDYETGSDFSGTVKDNAISFYDYQDNAYYNFTI